ncbi:hypothetical protein FHG87_017199 [Trinorchestia longiramus]|nr:hypothetical protein FHG87_017199 [Trinorchestia longiramus]
MACHCTETPVSHQGNEVSQGSDDTLALMSFSASVRQDADDALPPTAPASPASGNDAVLPNVSTDVLDEFLGPDGVDPFTPLITLSPPATDRDYFFTLDASEGLADLFDDTSFSLPSFMSAQPCE